MNQTIEVQDLIEAMKSPVPARMDIWSAKECARYLKVEQRQFSEKLALQPDFPRPFRLPSQKGRGQKRRRAAEVMKWAEGL